MSKKNLNIEMLIESAKTFSELENKHSEPDLYGVTDGKAIGTYLEHKFHNHLNQHFIYEAGSSARGIDFPILNVDVKVTSIKQPQSSCPFRDASQKIYGLGYSLLIFVYDKYDDYEKQTGKLNIEHNIFVEKNRTADYQTTYGLNRILENNGNLDDILAFFEERMLPVDNIQAKTLAQKIINTPPDIGYLTVSNALQWRLQYNRVINEAGSIKGIVRII